MLLRFLEEWDDTERKNQQEQLRLSSLNEFAECDSGHNLGVFLSDGVLSDCCGFSDPDHGARSYYCRD